MGYFVTNKDTQLPESEPTYNLKYWLEFTNQNAISHRLEILQLGLQEHQLRFMAILYINIQRKKTFMIL